METRKNCYQTFIIENDLLVQKISLKYKLKTFNQLQNRKQKLLTRQFLINLKVTQKNENILHIKKSTTYKTSCFKNGRSIFNHIRQFYNFYLRIKKRIFFCTLIINLIVRLIKI